MRSYRNEVVTVPIGLIEQPKDVQVATNPCNMKLMTGIHWISVNHNGSTDLEWSVIENSGWLGGGGGFVVKISEYIDEKGDSIFGNMEPKEITVILQF